MVGRVGEGLGEGLLQRPHLQNSIDTLPRVSGQTERSTTTMAPNFGDGPNVVSESTVQTPTSVRFVGPHQATGRELSEFL